MNHNQQASGIPSDSDFARNALDLPEAALDKELLASPKARRHPQGLKPPSKAQSRLRPVVRNKALPISSLQSEMAKSLVEISAHRIDERRAEGLQVHGRERRATPAGRDEGRVAEPLAGPSSDCIAEKAIYDYLGREEALLRV